MSKLDEKQKKLVVGMSVALVVGAIILTVISFGRGEGISIIAPLLIIIGAVGVLAVNKK